MHSIFKKPRKSALFSLVNVVLGFVLALFPVGHAASSHQWITPVIEAPRVSHHTFASVAASSRVSYHLYKPAAYDREVDRSFPVVYWLHGSGGGLQGIPVVAKYFNAAIDAGQVPPFLVVFVNGLRLGMYVDWKDGSAPIESIIMKELIPHIDATYRTLPTRDGRLLDGFSMGGYGAARLAFKYPETFRAVSIMGGGPLQETLTRTPRASSKQVEQLMQEVFGGKQENFRAVSPRRHAADNAAVITRHTLVRVVIGSRDNTFDNNLDFHKYLVGLGIKHDWVVVEGVGHDPLGLLRAMGDQHWAFYREAFKPF
jgi:enterochelin esterase-like enzyme